jgi:hypothetical protein
MTKKGYAMFKDVNINTLIDKPRLITLIGRFYEGGEK